MGKALSVKELQRRYDGEWVLVADPELGEMNEVLSGRVLWHSKDRDEVYRKAAQLRPEDSAMLCFATLPEDAVVVL